MATNKRKILIVDDSIFARVGVKKLLRERKYELFEADNGLNALKIIDAENPDLIITDNLMPKMNGMQLIEYMKKNDINIPVIVISANQQEKTIQKFIELGIVGIEKKSPDKDVLLSLVDKAFEQESGE